MAKQNGTRRFWIIAGTIMIPVVAGAGFLVNGIEKTRDHVEEHEKLPGHPVIVERVATVQRTVDGIAADVKIILRRLPQRPPD